VAANGNLVESLLHESEHRLSGNPHYSYHGDRCRASLRDPGDHTEQHLSPIWPRSQPPVTQSAFRYSQRSVVPCSPNCLILYLYLL